jgi:hypothetical protein
LDWAASGELGREGSRPEVKSILSLSSERVVFGDDLVNGLLELSEQAAADLDDVRRVRRSLKGLAETGDPDQHFVNAGRPLDFSDGETS